MTHEELVALAAALLLLIAVPSLVWLTAVWAFKPLRAASLWKRSLQRTGRVLPFFSLLILAIASVAPPSSGPRLHGWQMMSRNMMEQLALVITVFHEDNGHYPERLSELSWPYYEANVTPFILEKNPYAAIPLLERGEIEAFKDRFAGEHAVAQAIAEQNEKPLPPDAPCPPPPPPSATEITAARAFIDAHGTYLVEVAPDGQSCLLHEPPSLWKGKGKDQIQYALIRPTDQEPLPHDYVKRTSSAEFARIRATVMGSH